MSFGRFIAWSCYLLLAVGAGFFVSSQSQEIVNSKVFGNQLATIYQEGMCKQELPYCGKEIGALLRIYGSQSVANLPFESTLNGEIGSASKEANLERADLIIKKLESSNRDIAKLTELTAVEDLSFLKNDVVALLPETKVNWIIISVIALGLWVLALLCRNKKFFEGLGHVVVEMIN